MERVSIELKQAIADKISRYKEVIAISTEFDAPTNKPVCHTQGFVIRLEYELCYVVVSFHYLNRIMSTRIDEIRYISEVECARISLEMVGLGMLN